MRTKVKDRRNESRDAPERQLLRNVSSALEQNLGPIEQRSIDDVLPYAGNPNKHSEQQIVRLMASIREFGFALPFLLDANGVLICGHARLQAALRLGVKEVPVLVARFWSESQVKAYRIADNELARQSSWDENLLRIEILSIIEMDETPIELIGIDTGKIDVLLDGAAPDDGEDAADFIPHAPVTPVARPGDTWLLGRHRLHCGSSLDASAWEQLMNGEVADLSLNDPPWNVRVNGHVSGTGRHEEFAMASGEMTELEFIKFNVGWLTHAKAHLADGGLAMAFMDHQHLFELMTAGREAKLDHFHMCVWAKTNAGLGSLWRSQVEYVLILKNGTAPHINNVQLSLHGRYRTTLWTCAGANSFGASRDADLAVHPTVKPIELLAEAIRDVTKHGDIVTDAFSGSGSTILACERTKRIGYAIEIEPKYVDVGIARWEQMTGRKAVLEATGQTFGEVATERLSITAAAA